jgi:cytochrome c oxidase assembly protein subunit 15
MVKSTDSGLAVPDWPLSYGMFFPPMVGGVFYEHGHRMIATGVGFLTLILAIWLGLKEQRRWVRNLGYAALGTVILQGVLGGITVLFFLPTPVSVLHGILAQIFFILTIIIAYSQSEERRKREYTRSDSAGKFLKLIFIWTMLVFLQLILGAIMRHTGSGLAIPDFPKMGGRWIPLFNAAMVDRINSWRFENNHDPVTQIQIIYHFCHRLGALALTIVFCILNFIGIKNFPMSKDIRSTLMWLDLFFVFQIYLGITTVITQKNPYITSLHVVTGAMILGISILLFLRVSPLSFKNLLNQVYDK